MKIENGYSRQIQQLKNAEQNQTERPVKSEEKSERKSGVSVEISKEAKALLEAEGSAQSKHVEEIKAQIEQGQYKINPEAISTSLLSTIQSQKEQ